VRPIWRGPLRALWFFLLPPRWITSYRGAFSFAGMRFEARHLDWLGVREVVLDREYDALIAHLRDRTAPVVLDLGANIGMFALKVFQTNRRSVVHSVEASRETYAVLEANRLANPGLAWSTHRLAIWGHDGDIAFAESPVASTASHVATTGAALVPARRLATLVADHVRSDIDLMKMDIEGAEEVALCGSADILGRTETLIVEVHPYRCSGPRIRELLHDLYPHVVQVTGRTSTKPLVIASRLKLEIPSSRPWTA
jgi:FkbM family methyltransferase